MEMMPIFVISLATASRRRANMIRRLTEMNFTFLDASTPDTAVGTFVPYLTGPQRACTHSHVLLWQKIVAENIPAALILEDDAVFQRNWLTIVNTKLQALAVEDPEWDALFLNVAEPYSDLERWHLAQDQCLSGAYIIKREAAQWLLDQFSSMYYMIDWMTQILQARSHSYTYYPWLVIQEGHDSAISNNVEPDRRKVERCLSEANYALDNYDC